jgi:Arc/MetJ family transcription regulator
MKRRTSVLLDETLLKKARKVLKVSTSTEAINKEVETALRGLIRRGRGRFVDVYR